MFEEPDEPPDRPLLNPADRAREKSDQFRMHAELCAVFEGVRKFDAQILSNLDAEVARSSQRTIATLEKSKSGEHPVLPEEVVPQAAELLDLANVRGLSGNDYHIHRRPGEVMILRWLEGEQVDQFYERLQAHFDAALNQFKEDERQAHGWKQDQEMASYLEAIDKISIKMEEKYLREVIRKHNAIVLSTQSADELDILHLTDFIMGVPAAEIVGPASAPPDQPTERDRAWFFKLFSLRGMEKDKERMCFFTYLQKSDDGSEW